MVGNDALLGVVDSLMVRRVRHNVLLGFGLVLALWSASGYVGTFTRASNRIYGVREGRSWWKLELLQIALAAVALVLLAVAGAGLVISGPLVDAVGNVLHASETGPAALVDRPLAGHWSRSPSRCSRCCSGSRPTSGSPGSAG